ncbi:MAG TPA: hypothetical protein VGM39_20075 [Kofleriaceae bacterium]
MITDSQLQLFVRTLTAHKHIKRGAITRYEGSDELPEDVRRLLEQVGGWRYGDSKFTELAQLPSERDAWNKNVDDHEAGTATPPQYAFWNRAWYPLLTSPIECYAFDPVGFFGGAPNQVVHFDAVGGEEWLVFPSTTMFLSALIEGFEAETKGRDKDALVQANMWAKKQKGSVSVKLPQGPEEQRAPERFNAGVGAWTVLRHPDGRVWSARERRDGYEIRIGEGEDAIIRKRSSVSPGSDVRKLIKEQKTEGFAV